MTDRSLTLVVPGIWQRMREMRQEVRGLVAEYGSEVQNAAVVAANELVENGIKYGAAVPEMSDVNLNVDLVDHVLSVRVTNGYDNVESVRRLQERLDELRAGDDPLSLFLRRLDELTHTRDETMGLGIYRVAAEGGFTLDVDVTESVITVVAKRTLK